MHWLDATCNQRIPHNLFDVIQLLFFSFILMTVSNRCASRVLRAKSEGQCIQVMSLLSI